ncbi:LBP / BPI / CETP family protein [Dirofilaria immitis]|nr:LBP / BPI / CETP family protein [Dirofilaria immitis]
MEIGMQPLLDNIEKFTDNIIITEWLNRDDQKHDNELVRQSRAIGYPRSAGISPHSTYSQGVVYRGSMQQGKMNAAQSRSSGNGNGMRSRNMNATQIGAHPQIDFNPALLRGYHGLPGARIRINKRAFEYFSSLARYVLDEQIPLIKIPDINQKIEQVSAEVTVCNIFVSNYRSPKCLDIYPAAPNIIVFSIQDLDVGLTANLDARARILLIPLRLSGVVHANIYHASATITLGIVRTPFGTPQLFLVGCDIKIPFADQELSAQIRKMIPERACKALPDIINQRVNPMLARFPQSIPFSQLSSTLFAGLLGGGTPPIPPHCYSPQCQARFMMTTKAPTTRLPSTRNGPNAMPPRNPPSPMLNQSTNRVTNSRNNNNIKSAASVPIHTAIPGTHSKLQINIEKKGEWRNYVGSEIPAEMNIKDKNQKYTKSFTNTELMAQSFNQPVKKLNPPSSSSSYARAKREIVGFENLSSNIPNNITIKSGTAIVQSPQTVILQLPPKILQPLRKSQQKPNENLKFIDGKNSAMLARPSTTAQKLSTHAPTLPKHSSKATAFSGPRTAVSDKFNRSAMHGVQSVQVRHPGVYQPRHPGVYQSGHRGGYQPGHPGVYQPGHPGVYQPGHPGVYQSGHPGVYQPGYQSRVNQAVGVGPAGSSDPCAGCPPITGGAMAGIGSLLTQQLDLGRVANLVLTTQLLHIYATPYDFNLDLNGEFSPYGFGGTPFAQGLPMVEIMISDFTINSLFYWLHRANFIAFRIGPEIPGIGALLTTTCETTDDYTEEEFEDEENEELLMRLLRLSQRRRRFRLHHQRRSKRQENGNGDTGGGGLGDLAGLGICIGDIAPAIKEEYPNRTLALILHTARAPSITIHRRATTFIQLDLMLFVDIYLDQTTTRVGTITVTIVMDIMVQIMGNRIIGNASLPVLSLMDRDKTLGLEQDTFDNLASLAKDMFLKAVNDRISKGIEIPFPTMANLPVVIMNPQIHILEHAIYIGADFVVSPSTLQMLSFSALTMGSQNPQR